MIYWIKSWLFHRRAKHISTQLIPWLLFYGDKEKYSKDEVDYAIERSQLSQKYTSLAYAIFCNELTGSQFYKNEGYAEYVHNSHNFHRAAQKYGTGTTNSKTSVFHDIDKG